MDGLTQHPRNALYYGDNLDVLRNHVRDESVDLVYLDPPFNSNATYNVLFKAPSGDQSAAQIEAFADTWHWSSEAETAFLSVLRNSRYPDVGTMLQAMRSFLRENDMMAYLAMMAVRLIELHRVLKPTGSLYLHCDPTASHYLKILLDAVVGADRFRAELSWRRQSAHNDGKQGRRQYGNIRDVILFYSKGDTWTWNQLYTPYDEKYVADFYRHVEALSGRRYRLSDISGPGGAANGNPGYEVMGVTRYWRYSKVRMDELIAMGRIVQTRPGAVPAEKRYLDEMPGVALQNDWSDIRAAAGKENMGYPTQKPLALLERIISASSNPGDVVLDPFCGCGSAVHAAQKLGRNWIGIDVTHLAISLIERRLRDAFPSKERSDWGVAFDVHGTPKDIGGARDLAQRDKYQFQWWAVSLVDAVPYGGQKKGADSGIDGWRYMAAGRNSVARCIISVKGGENVSVQMVRDLCGVIAREKAEAGLFVTLAEPTRPMREEAAKAGYFGSPFGGKQHPRLQIMTIAALLNGAKPDLPPLAIDASFALTERAERAPQTQGMLPEIDRMAGLQTGKRSRGVRSAAPP